MEWNGLDPGREGLWEEDVWLGVLRLISEHEGEQVYDEISPIYTELEDQFPGNAWRSQEQGGRFRPLFRDYPHPWTRTKVIDIEDHTFKLTALGERVLRGQTSRAEVIRDAIAAHKEDDQTPSFVLLAGGLREAARALDLRSVYFGLMQGFRPGLDDINVSLASIPAATEMPQTPRRRLRAMLRLLEIAGSAAQDDNGWIATDADALIQASVGRTWAPLASSYRKASEEPKTSVGDPFVVDPDKVDRALAAHARLQNELAQWAADEGYDVHSPGPTDPNFDLAWSKDDGHVGVAEIKSLSLSNEVQQLRLGVGQLLDFKYQLSERYEVDDVVLFVERAPSDSRWNEICASVGIDLRWPET